MIKHTNIKLFLLFIYKSKQCPTINTPNRYLIRRRGICLFKNGYVIINLSCIIFILAKRRAYISINCIIRFMIFSNTYICLNRRFTLRWIINTINETNPFNLSKSSVPIKFLVTHNRIYFSYICKSVTSRKRCGTTSWLEMSDILSPCDASIWFVPS